MAKNRKARKALAGQVSVEFLLMFTAALALISMLASAILSQNDSAKTKLDDFAMINLAEGSARAVEAVERSGSDMRLDMHDERVRYRIENGRFYVEHEGKLIEVGGVFSEDDAEPV